MTTHDIKAKIDNAADKVSAAAHKVGDKIHDAAAKVGEKLVAAEEAVSKDAHKAGHTLAECTVKGCNAVHVAAGDVAHEAQKMASKAESKGHELAKKADAATKKN